MTHRGLYTSANHRTHKIKSTFNYLFFTRTYQPKDTENYRDREKTYPKHHFKELFHSYISNTILLLTHNP